MRQKMGTHQWPTFLLLTLLGLAVVVAGCGGGASMATNSGGSSAPITVPQQAHSAAQNQKNASALTGPLYLIKSLNITMELKDTQQAASDLQAWITTTDSLATADNINYQQVGNNLYNITMSFSVQASLYPRIESYLNSYPAQHHGQLITTTRNTQDVTGTYIDTQSQLKNLKAEQERLLTLVSHAAALSDILALDQRLTDVEGQIEQIESQLNSLTSQTSFYTITINLQPPQDALTPPPAAWSPVAIWQGAVGAAIVFGQVLATIVIWLLVFSIYIVPVALIIWLVQRWRRSRTQYKYRAPVASTFNPPLMKSVQPQQSSQAQADEQPEPEPQLKA
nr:DUF4349 domain-containing protein [Ktedonobacteraceae bacterium]